MLGYILLFTFLGSLLSLIGSYLLILRKGLTEALSNQLLNFAAGALLATAFLDLRPEAIEFSGENDVFIWALAGFISFFFAERFIRVFHLHHSHGHEASTLLILIGDGIHNFIDGIAITIAFLTNVPLGITTSLAVAAHEIPQEIADMGVLLANGVNRKKALFYNFLSALTALVGALLAFFFASFIQEYLYIFLAITAGHFIYISASDLIPVLHEKFAQDKKWVNGGLFLLGIISVYLFTTIFES
jgi:zinc and cadmium transporter